MKKAILSDYRRFNANPKDSYTGDCYIRALCIAYGLPYESVRNELNKIKREGGFWAPNITPVLLKFARAHGAKSISEAKDLGISEDVTLEDFANSHPDGTYLVFTSDKGKKSSDHIVCVLDGDYWDSWDSTKQMIHRVVVVEEENTSSKTIDVKADDVADELMEFTQKYLDKIHVKCPYFDFEFKRVNQTRDEYMFAVRLYLTADESKLPPGAEFYKSLRDYYTVSCKINPRVSLEDNLSVMKSKINVGFREFVYKHRKAVEDYTKYHASKVRDDVVTNNKRAIMSLPAWCHPLIRRFMDYGEIHYGFRYYLRMDTLPGDYDEDPVEFSTDTLSDMKYCLQVYQETFKRVDF